MYSCIFQGGKQERETVFRDLSACSACGSHWASSSCWRDRNAGRTHIEAENVIVWGHDSCRLGRSTREVQNKIWFQNQLLSEGHCLSLYHPNMYEVHVRSLIKIRSIKSESSQFHPLWRYWIFFPRILEQRVGGLQESEEPTQRHSTKAAKHDRLYKFLVWACSSRENQKIQFTETLW